MKQIFQANKRIGGENVSKNTLRVKTICFVPITQGNLKNILIICKRIMNNIFARQQSDLDGGQHHEMGRNQLG